MHHPFATFIEFSGRNEPAEHDVHPPPFRIVPFEDFTGDLSEELGQLVEREPVSRVRLPSGVEAWLVTGYDEVCQVLTEPRITRMVGRDGPPIGVSSMSPDAPKRSINMDGALHAALRRLASPAFTARQMEQVRPRVRQIADELVTAWMAGLLAGLRREGIDLALADLIVGTSAGAIVGAVLATGQRLDRLAVPPRPAHQKGTPPGWRRCSRYSPSPGRNQRSPDAAPASSRLPQTPAPRTTTSTGCAP
jgi:cytochrome P450